MRRALDQMALHHVAARLAEYGRAGWIVLLAQGYAGGGDLVEY